MNEKKYEYHPVANLFPIKRYCPQCNKELTYTLKSGLRNAIKNNTSCKVCKYKKISESNKGKLGWWKGKKRSIENRLKLSIANTGKHMTDTTKKKLSEITKSQWKSGIHKRTFKSKGQLEVIEILIKLGYNIEDEYLIDGRPYDVFVKDKNLLIEFNGTFWHRDPRFYKADDKCKQIWNKDLEKLNIAKKYGCDLEIIWQHDWENSDNKIEFIKGLL